ncbi:hypothetical protein QNI19_17770 [Cytophagaceae bacterium DM2B3-1]|uniref:Uncharacterized protein n=1 Tax=Xanthocytophaga flava TaxID=3048013 RepID=A0ABT7CM31_9BACT|nr:hypothetical protein [Xanthocytophaga flavus]MDJ1494792.1 hypothetical protein [Xanthocytophaga flavus]
MNKQNFVRDFTDEWNHIVPSVSEFADKDTEKSIAEEIRESFLITNEESYFKQVKVDTLIESLFANTDIEGKNFGSIFFALQLEYNHKQLLLAFYNESVPIYLDLTTQEMIAQEEDNPQKYFKVAVNEEAFLKSLLIYGRLYFDNFIKKKKASSQDIIQLYATVGGEVYASLYKLLLAQIS